MFTISRNAVACRLVEWLSEHCAGIFPQYSVPLPFLENRTVLVWKHLTKTGLNSVVKNKSKGLRWWWGGVGVCGVGAGRDGSIASMRPWVWISITSSSTSVIHCWGGGDRQASPDELVSSSCSKRPCLKTSGKELKR